MTSIVQVSELCIIDHRGTPVKQGQSWNLVHRLRRLTQMNECGGEEEKDQRA